MAYRHVDPPANLDYGPRGRDPLAICWHMAEGTNVAAYLSRNPLRGVSVNGVIESDGEIVTMVPWGHVAGSLNPNLAGPRENGLRQDDDPPGSLGTLAGQPADFFGATVAKQLLGSGWRDPNRYVVAFEIAGTAVAGPNEAQVQSMVRITAELRAMFPSLRGNLGHRDFQHVKQCPGKKIPWARLGGHGLFRAAPAPQPEASDMLYDYDPKRLATVKPGATLAEKAGGPEVAKVSGGERYAPGYDATLKHIMIASDYGAGAGKSRGYWTPVANVVSTRQETPPVPPPAPAPGGFTQADIDAAKTAQKAADDAAYTAELAKAAAAERQRIIAVITGGAS